MDSQGEPWIAGSLNPAGNSLPTQSPVELGGPACISQFSADLTQLLFSTDYNSLAGLALDSQGLAYVGGTTATYSAFVDKIDPAPSALSIQSITNQGLPILAPFFSVAPGEAIQILGANMGPATVTHGVISSGVLATSAAGVQVMFDGVAAPLLSVSAQQIGVMAPFELAGRSTTTVQVLYDGIKSNAVQVVVGPRDFEILAVLNQDFTLNSAANPAKPGAVLEIYLAGVGNSDPPSQDGQVNGPPLAALPINIQIAWYAENSAVPNVLPVSFSGAAYGLAAGIFQINFQAPPGTTAVSIAQVIAPNTFSGGTGFTVYVGQ